MAQFRGTIQGNRTEASRLGTKESGLSVNAASWEGAVQVDLCHDSNLGVDMVHVYLRKHVNGAGANPSRTLYDGPVSGELLPTLYDEQDVGCWVDGAFGDEHLRARLADMLEDIEHGWGRKVPAVAPLVRELRKSQASDDSSEVYDAIDLLTSFTADGLCWMLESGDLYLVSESEAE